MIRTSIRGLAFVFIILRFILRASFVYFTEKDRWLRTSKLAALVQQTSQQALIHLNIELEVSGSSIGQGYLQVGNHMSYLDVFIMASIHPTCFVTSVEMRDTPILGHLCRIGGCLFVERRNKNNIHKEISEITEALSNDLNVTIFPEATSTNGDAVIRFRRPLYTAAVQAKRSVQPFCIQYLSIDGEPVTRLNRDELCWYDDMAFAGHFINILSKRKIKIKVSYLNTISYDATKEAKDFVDLSYQMVSSHYKGFTHQDKLAPAT